MKGQIITLLLILSPLMMISCTTSRDPRPYRFSSPLLNRYADSEKLFRRYKTPGKRRAIKSPPVKKNWRLAIHNRLRRRLRRWRRRWRRRWQKRRLSWRHPGLTARGLTTYFRQGSDVKRRRLKLVRTARSLLGKRRIKVRGRRFRYDCAGLAHAVYYSDGVNLYGYPGIRGKRGGVRALVKLARKLRALHRSIYPRKGDLVFFHNTYDYTRDGRNNDWFSHVGIVEKVDKDGTVTFIDRYGRSIKRNNLNLLRPHVWRARHSRKRLNSFMRVRRRKDPRGMKYLAGQLFAGFATLIR